MFRSNKRKLNYKNNYRFSNKNRLQISEGGQKVHNNYGKQDEKNKNFTFRNITSKKYNGIYFNQLNLGIKTTSKLTEFTISSKGFSPNPEEVLMWLDASDNSTITVDGSNNVTQWESKASSGEIAITGEAPNYNNSLNGLKVVEFNDDYLYIDLPILSSTHLTFFIVFKHSNKEHGMPSFARSPANLGIHYFVDTDYRCYTNSGNSYSYDASNNNFTYSSDYQVLGADTETHQVTTTGTYRLCIGGDVFYRGYRQLYGSIAEYVIVPNLLIQEEKDKYFGYLHHKWGLTNQLPLTHPYKDSPPT